jgi:hypothetical protein
VVAQLAASQEGLSSISKCHSGRHKTDSDESQQATERSLILALNLRDKRPQEIHVRILFSIIINFLKTAQSPMMNGSKHIVVCALKAEIV